MTTKLLAVEALFKALADTTRLRILGLLVNGEICVCHLHEALRLPQPTVSRHLAYLRRSGLVETRRDGLWIHYRLAHLDDTVLRTLREIATHALGHVNAIARDAERLQRRTGCCAPAGARDERPALACCAEEHA
ncbi:MAG: metalloregulator ArsR/SmtB family transcription factor [Acidobacteria bacterium]|nr:metalloregulator ArsR/SmtB family transcription factor [Acidobacteriota bacterium]